ncbi:MAG: hypothetical protein AAGK37_00540 [Pseudomonadota bacterium]
MKTTKTLFVALAFAALPSLGFAMGCNYGESHASMSCADGFVWDGEKGACVQPTG